MSGLPRQKRPCAECPFRRDVEPGQFPAERYEALRASCRDEQTTQAWIDAPMFACPASGWPELFADYEAMAEAQGGS